MDIIVDTREQLPLFTRKCIRFKLLVGDYSTVVLRDSYCIERKSLQDLYGTITKGHVRFRNEILRAKANNIILVLVIEGTRKNFINKNFPGGRARLTKGETLDKIMTTIEQRYGIDVIWCRGRGVARKCITQLLTKKENEKTINDRRTTVNSGRVPNRGLAHKESVRERRKA